MKKIIHHQKFIVLVIFLLFGIYQMIQHSFVWFYHDDYGYVSLHYGTDVGTLGMNYTFMDIFHFLKWQYYNWSGRVLPFFYFIAVTHIGGLPLLRFVQAAVITLIMYEMYLLTRGKRILQNSQSVQPDSPFLAFTAILLWGTFSITVARDGVYWFTASVLYTWPMAFFLGAVLVSQDIVVIKNRFLKTLVLFLLYFLAACSQEQMAVITISYALLDAAFSLIHRSKTWIPGVCGALPGGCIEILAPGNFVRAAGQSNEAFFSLPFWGKIKATIPTIVSCNIGQNNFLFFIFVCSMVFMACIILWQGEKSKKRLLIFILADVLSPFICFHCYQKSNYGIGLQAVLALWAAFAAWVIVWYCLVYQEYCLLFLCISALCSQGMMLVSPTYSYRCAILFQYLVLASSLLIFKRFLSNCTGSRARILTGAAYIALALLFSLNSAQILRGYYSNHSVNTQNNQILREAVGQIRAGMEVTTIELHRLKDDRYGNDMPYNKDKEYIAYWIKDYYDLPQTIELIYSSE